MLAIFDGADSIEARLERLVRATTAFFEQSSRLQRMWNRERLLTPIWTAAGATYGARWEQLFRSALGPLADDPDAMAIIRAVLEPSFVERVRDGTRSGEEAAALITATISPWFSARLAERTP